MKLSRRQAALGVAALGASTAPMFRARTALAQTPTYVIRCGYSYTDTHPLHLRMKAAADKIKQQSNGQIDLRLFPNSALGDDPAVIDQVRSGAVELTLTTVLYLESLFPQVNASGMGFAFKTLETAWAAWDGSFGAYIRQNFPQKTGMLILGNRNFDNGFRDVTSNRPIAKPADLAGLKIRVPKEDVLTSLFSALGAAPTPLGIKEVYTALQTHVVDAQENDLAHIELWKFYEVQKYVSLTNHIWDGMWPMANPAAFAKLPAPLLKIVVTNLDAAAVAERADMKALNTSVKATLQQKGMQIVTPDIAPFRQTLKTAGYYATWKSKIGPEVWALLEKYTGPLG